MHPLINNLAELKDNELEVKITELTRKYFMVQNVHVQQQIIMTLESYKSELSARQLAQWNNMMETRNKDLDKLINIS